MKKLLVVMAVCCSVCAIAFGKPAFYAQGSGDKKIVALSFDDGPGPYTARVLAILKEHAVQATFFMEGQQAQSRPQFVAAVKDGGHEIGNHTYSHINYYAYKKQDKEQVLTREILQAEQAIMRTTGVKPHLLRMPNGYSKGWARELVAQQGYEMVNWSFGCDWKKIPAAELYAVYAKNIHPGAIFLMHDGGKNRQTTVDMLPKLIDEIKRQGYDIVTVGQLLGI
ncbi:MAG: polysaccharide deacetylase family protein [Elusimicrobia bacterium]|nr:polysaccharide deacetylase family protein [Elusimicrobiota bacterium]